MVLNTNATPEPDKADAMKPDPMKPDPARWAVETFQLKKHFAVREGLPVSLGWGAEHWLVSTLIKYRQPLVEHFALNGADLQVARGELLGLLGRNGAGKTTLIKCLSTLLQIDGGAAFVNGFDVAREPDQVRLSINLVGSGHWVAFDWGLTVRQNLHFFGSLYGLSFSERRERIEAALEVLNLTAHAAQTPRGLSSGERQRMLLAKGFMLRTPVFFLDEPTVGLDPQGAREVRQFIKRELLGQSDRSGILTTHRLNEAEELCSRIAVIHQGRIVAQGTPLELKRLAGQAEVLEVRAAAAAPESLAAIQRLPGVKHAALTPVGETSIEDALRVQCEDADALAGPVVDLLRRHGAHVNSVETQPPSLEDAFIALTSATQPSLNQA